jgi:small subunit ribosomal protein S11
MADEMKMVDGIAVPVEAGEGGKAAGAAAAKARGKKKAVKQVATGKAYVQATYNNTIVTLTDMNGNVLGWSSAGKVGFKGPKKATPYAASMIVKDLCDRLKDVGLREVSAFVTGVGSGREAAVRAFHANGLNVTSIKDMTPIPHNGCRAPKPRRV